MSPAIAPSTGLGTLNLIIPTHPPHCCCLLNISLPCVLPLGLLPAELPRKDALQVWALYLGWAQGAYIYWLVGRYPLSAAFCQVPDGGAW